MLDVGPERTREREGTWTSKSRREGVLGSVAGSDWRPFARGISAFLVDLRSDNDDEEIKEGGGEGERRGI